MRKVLLLLVACAAMTGCSKAAPPNANQTAFVPDDHTQLLLHFDGNLDDAGPWHIGSTMQKGTAQWVPGRFGQALDFDGKTIIQQPAIPQLNVGDNSWTVEAWIKPDKTQPPYSVIFGGGWSFNRIYSLRIVSGKYLQAGFNDGSGNLNVNNTATSPDVSAALFDGNWHEVAMVLDRSRHGEIRLYLDGKQIKTDKLAFSRPMLLESGAMGSCVGDLVPWNPGSFNGAIDELRVSNIVRPEYAATYPIPSDQLPPPESVKVPFKYNYNPADSRKPLELTPESTFIVPVSIVGEGNTSKAANLLQGYLRKVYGVKDGFNIVDQDKVTSLDGKAILALGDSKWADDATLSKIPRFGYEMKRKANVVIIAGKDSDGTLAGAVHFLDEFAGVRFYMPGDLWISVPAGKKITLGDINEMDSPFVIGTVMTGMEGVPGMSDWTTYNQIYRRIGGTDQHNMFQMFPPSLYADKYPNVYSILKGVRHIPQTGQDQGWQPNFAAPETLEAAKDSVTRYFKANPNDDYVAMGMQDSNAFDDSPATQAIIKQYQQKYPDLKVATAHAYSEIYWQFMNKLGEWMQTNEPGKLLIGNAYNVLGVNPGFKLNPNIMVVTVWDLAELEADGRLKPDKNGVSELDGWLKIASHLGNHDWLQGNGYIIPRSYTHYYSTYLKALHKAGVQNSFQHLEAYPNWGMDGPKYWIINSLMWNPDQNVDALWKQFADDMYGPASAPMYDYFETLEKLWVQMDDVDGPERKLFRWNTQVVTTPASMALIKQARTDLDKATALAVTPEQKERVQLFNKTFHLSEMLWDLAAAPTVKQDDIDAIKLYFLHEIAPDPMTLYSDMRHMKSLDDAIRGAVGRKTVEN